MAEGPSNWDVMCGRGMAIRTHVGNQNYINLIQGFREEYENTPKGRKMEIVKRVIDAVSDKTGRFLQKKGEVWVELDAEKVIQKTSQAFRDLRSEDTARVAAQAPTTIKKVPIKTFDYSLLKKHAPAGRFTALLQRSENAKAATSDVTTAELSSSSSEESSDDSRSGNEAKSGDDDDGSSVSSSEEESDNRADVSETETEDSFPISRDKTSS